jgi:hypothetical protein
LFIVCLILASVGRAVANPVKFIQIDTKGNDEHIQLGLPNKDVILQFGFGGNGSLYGEEAKVMILLFRNGLGGN